MFRYILPVLAVLKNCSAITTQGAAIVSSSFNNVINDSHIATATTAAFKVRQLQCNMASPKKAQRKIFDLGNKKMYTLYLIAENAYIFILSNDS